MAGRSGVDDGRHSSTQIGGGGGGARKAWSREESVARKSEGEEAKEEVELGWCSMGA